MALIPLYAVGVFLAFTLSQAGMVVRWWRLRDPHWRKSMLLNATGAAFSGVAFVVAAVTKFLAGAWVALVSISVIILVADLVRRHYMSTREALALDPVVPRCRRARVRTGRTRAGNADRPYRGGHPIRGKPRALLGS